MTQGDKNQGDALYVRPVVDEFKSFVQHKIEVLERFRNVEELRIYLDAMELGVQAILDVQMEASDAAAPEVEFAGEIPVPAESPGAGENGGLEERAAEEEQTEAVEDTPTLSGESSGDAEPDTESGPRPTAPDLMADETPAEPGAPEKDGRSEVVDWGGMLACGNENHCEEENAGPETADPSCSDENSGGLPPDSPAAGEERESSIPGEDD